MLVGARSEGRPPCAQSAALGGAITTGYRRDGQSQLVPMTPGAYLHRETGSKPFFGRLESGVEWLAALKKAIAV